jgi:2'-5' RNA ligase
MTGLLIPLEEMAERLKRTPRQFRKDITTRKIPHLTLGRVKLFDPEKVIEHLTAPSIKAKGKSRTVVETEGRFSEALGL